MRALQLAAGSGIRRCLRALHTDACTSRFLLSLQAGAFDRFLNVQITVLILVQAVLCVACFDACAASNNIRTLTAKPRSPPVHSCVGMTIGCVMWRRSHQSHWYFMWQARTGNNKSSDLLYGILNFLTFWYAHARRRTRLTCCLLDCLL